MQPPDSDQYHSQLFREIVHRVYLNAIPYLSIRDQSDCEFPFRRGSSVFMNVSVREHRALSNCFFDTSKFTTLSPLSLLSTFKFSFQIIGLNVSSLPNFALKFPNGIFWWLRKVFVHLLWFLMETFFLGACAFRTMISHQRPLNTIHDMLSRTNSTLVPTRTVTVL
jgi:hypothetical protein